MNSILPFVIIGVATGSLYGLAGLGLVLTYRTSGIFNFGHGTIAAGAAFAFYSLHVTYRVPWPIAALIVIPVFAVVVGIVMERITRGLSDVPEAVVVVATVGILLGLEGLLYLLYGNLRRPFPDFLPVSGFTISSVIVTWAQIISVGVATTCALVLYAFLRWSRRGVAMQAVVDNPTLLSLAGERPARVRTQSWMIGSGFAALSGVLLAPVLGLDAHLLTFVVVQAFGAAAIGRFSSLPLTYAGGIVVGVVAALTTKYTSGVFSGIPSAVPFLVLVAVLLALPASKLPKRRATLRALVAEPRPMPLRFKLPLVLIGGGVLLVLPELVGAKLAVWTSGVIYVIIFGSLGLLVWTSGQISLCHAAFVALGATTMSHLAGHLPWAVALLLAGLLTVPVGALVAIPAIRLSGIYLALGTLGFGVLMQNVIYPTSWMFGVSLAVSAPRPQWGPIDGRQGNWLYYVVLVVAAATMAVLALIAGGRLGRVLRAMSETPTMLSTHGLGVNMTRLIVFCVSAFFAGIGGALVVTQYGSAGSVGFGPLQSLMLLAVLAISGTRLLRSSILAALLFAVVPGYLGSFDLNRQTFGFGVVAIAAALVIARRPQIAEWLARNARASGNRLRECPTTGRRRPATQTLVAEA